MFKSWTANLLVTNMGTSWRILSVDGLPSDADPLLYKCDVEPTSYTVWVTNLTQVWSENLDRRGIIRRSFDLNTSIDPSEDAEQFKLCLNCVQDALGRKSDSAPSLQRYDASEMIISAKLSLPGDLASFEWRFSLHSASSKTLVSQLLFPLFNQRLFDSTSITSLLQTIREKDIVISRLMSAIQADGISISRVFPGAPTSKTTAKASSREQIGKSVKGVAEFDLAEWEASQTYSRDIYSRNTLLARIFPDEAAAAKTGFPFQDLDGWSRLVRGNHQTSMDHQEAISEVHSGGSLSYRLSSQSQVSLFLLS